MNTLDGPRGFPLGYIMLLMVIGGILIECAIWLYNKLKKWLSSRLQP